MNENNYTPPQPEFISNTNSGVTLASRWKRLCASLIDALIQFAILLPVMFFTGGFSAITRGVKPSLGYNLLMGVLGIIVFFVIHGKSLAQSGQTVGKKALNIKIVDMNGNLPTFKEHLVKRYAAYFIPSQIPTVGQFINIINILFIFGKEKRCIHDLIAGTKVIDC